jgi:hypothetical protein
MYKCYSKHSKYVRKNKYIFWTVLNLRIKKYQYLISIIINVTDTILPIPLLSESCQVLLYLKMAVLQIKVY